MGVASARSKELTARVLVLLVAALMPASFAPSGAAAADKEQVLYSFCSTGGSACTDGVDPFSSLIIDPLGNLYGTTYVGGAYGGKYHSTGGVVFELVPNANRTSYAQQVLYSFCATGDKGSPCTDGALPLGSLLMDTAGHLYGTTLAGGAYDAGVVFELTPNAAKTGFTQKVLHAFCSEGETSAPTAHNLTPDCLWTPRATFTARPGSAARMGLRSPGAPCFSSRPTHARPSGRSKYCTPSARRGEATAPTALSRPRPT